jgi:hypothetical protein
VSIGDWWPRVKPSTRSWLIAHNGEPLPPAVVADIAWNGVPVNTAQSWIERSSPEGFFLTAEAIHWIEATADENRA